MYGQNILTYSGFGCYNVKIQEDEKTSNHCESKPRNLTSAMYYPDIQIDGGVSNRWSDIWNGTAEWKMEWNGEYTQLQLTCATGAVVQGCGSYYCMCLGL